VPSGKKLKFSFRAKFASEKLNYVSNTFFMSAASCAAAEQHAGLNIFSPPPWKQSTKETFSPLLSKNAQKFLRKMMIRINTKLPVLEGGKRAFSSSLISRGGITQHLLLLIH
jgi:hypothetical protein